MRENAHSNMQISSKMHLPISEHRTVLQIAICVWNWKEKL